MRLYSSQGSGLTKGSSSLASRLYMGFARIKSNKFTLTSFFSAGKLEKMLNFELSCRYLDFFSKNRSWKKVSVESPVKYRCSIDVCFLASSNSTCNLNRPLLVDSELKSSICNFKKIILLIEKIEIAFSKKIKSP